MEEKRQAFLFDLDGTPIDSVCQRVLAWQDAPDQMGIELAVWRIHRKMGMSGGLFANALMRETDHVLTPDEASRLRKLHGEALPRARRSGPPAARREGAADVPDGDWRAVGPSPPAANSRAPDR